MGGYGSGARTSRRRKTVECVRLPVREFSKATSLRPGERVAGECYVPATSQTPSVLLAFVLDVQHPESAFSLSYLPPAGGNRVTVQGSLLWSQAGRGSRVWWACPECQSRRGDLYLPPGETCFACRACHNLRFASTAMTPRARHERLARRYYRLAGSESYGLEFTPRPKGMRRATFNRNMDRAMELEHQGMALARVPRLLTA